MTSELVVARESRISTRVPLRISIKVRVSLNLSPVKVKRYRQSPRSIDFHNRKLSLGTRIEIEVYFTGKCAKAKVVYVSPLQSLHCGIELAEPRNIWGISLTPDDSQ